MDPNQCETTWEPIKRIRNENVNYFANKEASKHN